MALWPMITYYFYKSVKENEVKDWIFFGILSALGALCKYQIIFLFFALFLYLVLCDRKQFKQKGMYLAILVGSLIILPHIIYLFRTDFFSFIYMAERTEIGSHNTPKFLIQFGRVVFPLKFLLDQVLSVASCIVVYLFLWLQTKQIKINKDFKNSESIFILLITFAPILTQGCMAAIENNRIMGIWGSIMVAYVGIFLFYFFPINFNEKTFNYFMKWAYALMTGWLLAVLIFSQLQVKRTLSYPYRTIMPEMNRIWDSQTNNAEFKYVYGHIDYVFQFHVYNERRPVAILETFGHKSPWLDYDDVKKSGVLIVGKNKKNLIHYADEMKSELSDNSPTKPEKYKFSVTNKLGSTKDYGFYYTIVPGKK
jgi:4-amino-4-deoxy-L-arabinose transferase-like glycosyltransferase